MLMHITREASMKMPAGKTSRTDKSCVEIILFPPSRKAFLFSMHYSQEAEFFSLYFSITNYLSVKANGKRLKKKV